MKRKKECIAMLLAGGQGSRLGILTKYVAKPAVPFGGKYRIIDFPLSNCVNSGIDTVGVLTQYMPLQLNAYIGNGQPWDLDRNFGGVTVLSPYTHSQEGEWYSGTANAIYQNMHFIEQYDPEYVLILSGDHIYKMDYSRMLQYHKQNQADCTIAVLNVSVEEASRFGIMNTDENNHVYEFEEKPKHPKSTKASMGIYIFTWEKLRKYLEQDEADPDSDNDFGKNIIPAMLSDGQNLMAYEFSDYWKDVGTIDSLWDANMELLAEDGPLRMDDPDWKIYARNVYEQPHYVEDGAEIDNSIITEGAVIAGTVEHSVIFNGVEIAQDAVVRRSVIMPDTLIGKGSVIVNAIIGQNTRIGENVTIGGEGASAERPKITVIGDDLHIADGQNVEAGEMVYNDLPKGGK